MWKSEEDVVRDFLIISAPVYPNSQESYNKFYCNRLKYNLQKQSKNLLEYVDPRNGEIIKEKDLLYDSPNCKSPGRGRGKIIKSSKLPELQLQKQLRMAKPFGYSNEIIESYYCKEKRFDKFCDSNSNSASTEEKNVFKLDKNKTFNSNNFPPLQSNKIKRVKAVRNSKTQNNALMLSLDPQLKKISKDS